MNRSLSFSSILAASVIGAASVVLSVPLQAEAMTFTEFKPWKKAAREVLPEVEPEDFTGISVDNQDVIDFSSFSELPIISTAGPDTADGRHKISIPQNGNNSRFRITLNNQNLNAYNLVTWTFTRNDVFGFFANFRNVDNGLTLTANNSNGTVETIDLFSVLSTSPTAVDVDGRFGILSDTAYNSVVFSHNGLGSSAFAVDDLSVAVPSPALLPGLVGMGIAALRKKSKAEEVEEA